MALKVCKYCCNENLDEVNRLSVLNDNLKEKVAILQEAVKREVRKYPLIKELAARQMARICTTIPGIIEEEERERLRAEAVNQRMAEWRKSSNPEDEINPARIYGIFDPE